MPRDSRSSGNLLTEWKVSLVLELVEDKTNSQKSGTLEFDNLGGNTVGLLMCMMKRYLSTGRSVIINDGFCVLEGLIELNKKSVFFM